MHRVGESWVTPVVGIYAKSEADCREMFNQIATAEEEGVNLLEAFIETANSCEDDTWRYFCFGIVLTESTSWEELTQTFESVREALGREPRLHLMDFREA